MTMTDSLNQDIPLFFTSSSGLRLAYRYIKAPNQDKKPTVVWLNGFKSDMDSTKALALVEAARDKGWNYLRFDYEAHGLSDGDWAKVSVGHWRQNVLDVVDHLTQGPLIVVGSSMGGWMASLLIKDRPERLKALVFIAPAPDFATELMLPNLTPEDRHALNTSGAFYLIGYAYEALMTQAFFDEAKRHNVLDAPLIFDGPVHILHGLNDDVVPWQHSLRLVEALSSKSVSLTLIKDGDHRLSSPEDIRRIEAVALSLEA
jgi:pimeloyl-ACP methyl ester carboxylesterase